MTWNFASLHYSCRCMGFWIFLFLVYWDFKSNQGERTAMFPASSVKGWLFLGQRWCCCMCSCHRLRRHRSFCLQTQSHSGSLLRPLFSGRCPPWKLVLALISGYFLQQSLRLCWLARFYVYSGKNWSKWLLRDLFPEVWNIQWNFLKLWLHDVFFFKKVIVWE